jgi:hypothetical protein
MKSEFIVQPRRSIGPISIGMNRASVRDVLGMPSYVEAAYVRWGIQFRDKDCYFDSAFQIRYDQSGRVEDIQASSDDALVVSFDGCDVHRSEVEEVVSVVSRHSDFDRTEREFPHTYWFPKLGLALWRQKPDSRHFDTINITGPDEKEEGEPGATDNPDDAQ